jgi:hypothetical protein
LLFLHSRDHSRADLHEVRIEVGQDALPTGETDVEDLRALLSDAVRDWARDCIGAFPGADLTEPELAAREAVLEMNSEKPWH